MHSRLLQRHSKQRYRFVRALGYVMFLTGFAGAVLLSASNFNGIVLNAALVGGALILMILGTCLVGGPDKWIDALWQSLQNL